LSCGRGDSQRTGPADREPHRTLAARRDRTLAAILQPIQQTYRQDQLRTAMELSQYMMQGMVLDNLAMDNESTDRLLDFLARQLLMLLRESAGLRGART